MNRRFRIFFFISFLACHYITAYGAYCQENRTAAFMESLRAVPVSERERFLETNRSSIDESVIAALKGKAKTLAGNSEYDEAQAYAEMADLADYIRLDRGNYRALCQYSLCRALITRNEYNRALVIAEKILKRNPENFYGHLIEANIYLYKMTDFDRAEEEARKAVALDPQSEEAHMILGGTYLFKKNKKAAFEEYQAILRINPQNGFARDRVAEFTGQVKQEVISGTGEALACFNEGEELFMKGMFKEAIPAYQKALEKDPHLSKASLYLGDCYFKMGDFDSAITYYRKSIEINPRDRQAHAFLGDVYERMYDRTGTVLYLDKAITCYENAVKIDPAYENAKERLADARSKKLKRQAP
jgi:tetratricopeptide (TPR) repeat protein